MAAMVVAMHRALCPLAGPSCGSGFEREDIDSACLGDGTVVPNFPVSGETWDRCHVGHQHGGHGSCMRGCLVDASSRS